MTDWTNLSIIASGTGAGRSPSRFPAPLLRQRQAGQRRLRARQTENSPFIYSGIDGSILY
jgi:hypothetical protein